MLLSKCAMNNSEKLRLIKEQESGGLLSKCWLIFTFKDTK